MMLAIEIVVGMVIVNIVGGFIVALFTIEPLQEYEKKTNDEIKKLNKK